MKTLLEVLESLTNDPRVGPIHLCLYLALWRCWEKADWAGEFVVKRMELMRMAKVQGKTTYYRVMRELHEMGYVGYRPGKHTRKGTVVGMKKI